MLELVDAHIEARLKLIEHGDEPIAVYPYIPDRDKGEAEYPCYAFNRLYAKPDKRRARPGHLIWTRSETEMTLRFNPRQAMGGPLEVTGPDRWYFKPFPTPVDVPYEIHALATEKTHCDRITELLFQAFPTGYMPNISGQYPLFQLGTPQNFDELWRPLYATITMLWVNTIWIERLESDECAPITDPRLDQDTMNYPE